MYQKIRITVASLAVIMICMISSTGTLSYFTDTDSATNEFTIGNASTILSIYDDVTDANSKHAIDVGDYSPLQGDPSGNATIPFYLQAENGGNIPVFQRFRVVIPIALKNLVTLTPPNSPCTIDTITSSNMPCYSTDVDDVMVGGVPKYVVYYFVSNKALGVGEKTSEWPFESIAISGLTSANMSLFTCEGNNNNNCVLGIDVYSDVIQTNGTDATDPFKDFVEIYN